MSQLTLVAGAGGFIGGHLVRDLVAKGVPVRAVDKKPLDDWYFRSPQAENVVADLQLAEACDMAVKGAAQFTIWPATWAAWALSRITKPAACCQC